MVGVWPGSSGRESNSPTTVPPPPGRGRPSAEDPGPGMAAPACRRLPPMAWLLLMLVRHVDLPRDIVERGRRGRSAIQKDNRKHGPSGRPRSTVKFAFKTTPLGSRDPCTSMVRPRHGESNARVSLGAPNVVQKSRSADELTQTRAPKALSSRSGTPQRRHTTGHPASAHQRRHPRVQRLWRSTTSPPSETAASAPHEGGRPQRIDAQSRRTEKPPIALRRPRSPLLSRECHAVARRSRLTASETDDG